MYSNFGPLPDDRSIHPARGRLRGSRRIAVVVAMLVAAPFAAAQQRVPLTLAEAEDLALADEPGQQALLARADAYNERAVDAGQLPHMLLRVGLNNYPIQSGGFSTEGMTNAGIGIRQEFPAGDTRSISARQNELLATASMQDADDRARFVLTETRRAWLNLYYLDQSRRLLTESRPFFDDLVNVTRSLYAVGGKNQQDVLRADLELSRLDDRLIDIERQQAQAKAALSEWIGQEAYRPVAAKLPQWTELPPLESMRENLQQHPALKAADAGIAAQEAAVELAEEQSRPGWALDVGYSYREGYLPDGEPRSDFISVNVTVGLPFLGSKSVDSNLAAALSDRSAAVSTREQMLRQLRSELDAEYGYWQELSRRLKLYEERILDQARHHAEATLLAYQSDQGDFADVMRGYIDVLNTRTDYVRLQVQRAQSYAVLANLGGLTR